MWSVLYHLTNPPRFSDQEKNNLCTLLNTAIGTTEAESKDILLAYYPAANPPAPGTTLLELFLHWARAMLTLLVFSFNKTTAAIELLQVYEQLVHITSRTGPLLQSLDLGITDRNDAHNLGKELIHFRDLTASRAQVYFQLKHPLHNNQPVIQQIHRLILSGFTVDNPSGLTGLRNAHDTDNLHLRMIAEDPLNPLQWGELLCCFHRPLLC